MCSFDPRKDTLPRVQLEIWNELHPIAELGFVLYGGTAIALRLGHRISEDFDFFTERVLQKGVLMERLPFMRRAIVLQDRPDTFTVQIPFGQLEYVKVSFFGSIGFGRVGQPDLTSDGVLRVASLDDLMANKVKVILQRVSAKDYVDIAAMLDAGVLLDKGLAAAREMFGHVFQPSESLRAMTYFVGGDLHLLSNETKRTLIRAARAVRELPHVQLRSRSLGALPVERDQDGPEEFQGPDNLI